MRFGSWREVMLAFAVTAAAGLLVPATTAADGWVSHTLPRSVPAYNLNTSGPFLAPPVPYGEYAKDYVGTVQGCLGVVTGGLGGLLHGGGLGCGACGGAGCGLCGGGLFHRDPCGNGCGGLFHGHGRACGLCGGVGCGLCAGGSIVAPSSQALPSGQACNACHGSGCGLCRRGHGGLLHGGRACGACGGAGCGLCRGGLLGHRGCGYCGGAGCGHCMGGGVGGALGLAHGLLSTAIHPHANRVKYFVGAGGPVPLTPGYVPYVVPTRSPRDFFAFPPFSPLDP